MALSGRPGRCFAISAHLDPILAYMLWIRRSSSGVHSPLLTVDGRARHQLDSSSLRSCSRLTGRVEVVVPPFPALLAAARLHVGSNHHLKGGTQIEGQALLRAPANSCCNSPISPSRTERRELVAAYPPPWSTVPWSPLASVASASAEREPTPERDHARRGQLSCSKRRVPWPERALHTSVQSALSCSPSGKARRAISVQEMRPPPSSRLDRSFKSSSGVQGTGSACSLVMTARAVA